MDPGALDLGTLELGLGPRNWKLGAWGLGHWNLGAWGLGPENLGAWGLGSLQRPRKGKKP